MEKSELASYYTEQGFVPHFNKIDFEVVAEDGCDKCKKPMRYIGLKKDNGAGFSYIAISHCDNCGNEYEF